MVKVDDDMILKIKSLYISGLSQREVASKVGLSCCTVFKHVKGIARSSSEATLNARRLGKMKLTEIGRLALSAAGRKSCGQSKRIWTKPEKLFKDVLNSIGIGVMFPDFMKTALGIKDDNNASIYAQYPIQRYLCDFVDVDNKLVFRINGDYWHANPVIYSDDKLTLVQRYTRKRDVLCKRFLESKGWFVCDIWQSELLWNINLVKEKIMTCRKLNMQNTPNLDDIAGDDEWSNKVKSLWFKTSGGTRSGLGPQRNTQKSIVHCKQCGKDFEVWHCQVKHRAFCSLGCSSLWSRKVVRPTQEELATMLATIPMTKIGKQYGVSDQAVRKWAKGYGIMV